MSGKWITASEFSSHFYSCFLEGNSEKYRNLHAFVTSYGGYSFYSHCPPEQLDLKWHIQEYSITDFGNGTLESFVATWLVTNTYQRNRPYWQIAILHFGEPANPSTLETGIVAKFSHALLDGYSFVHMIGKLTDNPAPYLVQDRKFSLKDRLKYIYRTPVFVVAYYIDLVFPRRNQSPFSHSSRMATLGKPIGQPQEWLMSFVTLNLKSIKMIRRATDCHFVCLIISAQFGALRKLLLETRKESELPEYLWTGCSLPWPNHPQSLTNHFCVGYFKCLLQLSDPLERLHSLEAYYRNFKENEHDVIAMFGVIKSLLLQVPPVLPRFLSRYDPGFNNVNLWMSPLMLSTKQHYLLGRPVKNLYLPAVIPDVMPVSLMGVTTSHSGQIDVSFGACSGVIVKNQEELDRLTQIYFIEELAAIAALAGLNDENKK